jgi:hypothetical protein
VFRRLDAIADVGPFDRMGDLLGAWIGRDDFIEAFGERHAGLAIAAAGIPGAAGRGRRLGEEFVEGAWIVGSRFAVDRRMRGKMVLNVIGIPRSGDVDRAA